MKKILSIIIVAVLVFSLAGCNTNKSYVDGDKEKTPEEITVSDIKFERIIQEDLSGELQKVINEENLKKEINRLNFKYPHIILAQAKLESGNFSSNIFKENHNLFGLKVAKLRCTTALGENLNHSIYKNWQSSVQDRAMWEIQNCKNIHSEEEYYQLLDAMYSETNDYSQMLKKLIK
jgi:hypothetical protein